MIVAILATLAVIFAVFVLGLMRISHNADKTLDQILSEKALKKALK